MPFFKDTHFVKVLLHNLELRILKNTRFTELETTVAKGWFVNRKPDEFCLDVQIMNDYTGCIMSVL